MTLLGSTAYAGKVTISVPISGTVPVVAPPAPAAGVLQHEVLVIRVLSALVAMSLILAIVAPATVVRTRRYDAAQPQEGSENRWREPGFDQCGVRKGSVRVGRLRRCLRQEIDALMGQHVTNVHLLEQTGHSERIIKMFQFES